MKKKGEMFFFVSLCTTLPYWSVPSGVLSTYPGAAIKSVVIGNIEIFGSFLGDLSFYQFEPTKILHFLLSQFHFIHHFQFSIQNMQLAATGDYAHD